MMWVFLRGYFSAQLMLVQNFFRVNYFLPKWHPLRYSKSHGMTQRSKRQREKLNILDAGLKTCHFAMADYSIKLSVSP